MSASDLRDRFERAADWLRGSDPGLLRLQKAVQTVLTLGVSLLVLYLLTTATGQPLTVALLGVVIAMMSAMAVNDPDPAQRKITMGLLPLPAAVAITLGAFLAPHRVAGEVVFVAVMFAAVYVRRFGGRGMALGMVAFMTYFFALFLGATLAQLPWLIGAVVVGTACSFVMRTLVFRDRPDRVLRRTLRALWARIRAVIGVTTQALADGQLNERHRRRLRATIARLNETALMVQNQLEDEIDPAVLWPGIEDDQLGLRLFDAELAAERLATAGSRAAESAAAIPADTRGHLVAALVALRAELREGGPPEPLDPSAELLRSLPQQPTGPDAAAYQLARAITAMSTATARTRELVQQARAQPHPATRSATPRPESSAASARSDSNAPDIVKPDLDDSGDGPPTSQDVSGSPLSRLLPSTRQAVQVAVAASLAIIAGEMLSPARWYWAVIAAFVTFSGTVSRGDTVTKGWQRLLGTVLGVPAGVLIATAVGGNPTWSLVLIFMCLFFGFYLVQVAYSLMIFWITTMLALLYGLLGQFSVSVLVLRIEETAIGAAIGVLVALLVLPTSTRATIRDGARTFLTTLGDLVEAATHNLVGGSKAEDLSDRTRALDQQLYELRATTKPLTHGIAGVRGRGSTRQAMRVLTACDHYARALARESVRVAPLHLDPALGTAVNSAAGQVQHNITVLTDLLEHHRKVSPAPAVSLAPATDLLDAAEQLALDHQHLDHQHDITAGPEDTGLLGALRLLRSIDQAILALAHALDASLATGTDLLPIPAPT